jgi:hypothetical protein
MPARHCAVIGAAAAAELLRAGSEQVWQVQKTQSVEANILDVDRPGLIGDAVAHLSRTK